MTDVLQVKEEPTSVVRESRLPNLPSDLTENESPQEYLSLEQVANNTEKLRKFELLDRYLLQLSKGEHYGNFDVAKDANYLRKLVRSDDTHVQVKVSELLLQYFKLMKLNTQFDPKLGGIKDSMLLLKLYQVVHDDCCYYLLPNSKAGETFNKFLCNLLSTASSEYVFSSVVRLFQRTVENVLSKYNNVHSPSVSREMSTEDTRVVIGVMKTLLTLTRAFGSPPAPREVLCSLSVVVINSTNAHTCRVYSYNVAAFLIKDVVEEDTRRRLLKGLNEVQYNQVVALVKECNSLNNTCNWKFKYFPSDYISSSSLRVQSESNLSYSPDSSTNTTHTVNTNTTTRDSNTSRQDNITNNSNIPTNSFSSGNTMASNSFSSGYSSNSHYSLSYSSVPSVPNVRKVVDSKKQQSDASELPNNWYKDLFNTFESNRGEGKNVVVDKNAWKWKNDALLNTLKKLESVSSVEMESVSGQFSTLFESLFKYESAIPVVINSLNLFTVLTVKGNCDFLSLGKCQLLSDMLFEKLKENNKKVRDACVQSLVEVVKRSKLNVVSESVKKALVNVSPTCRENMCNFLNGKLLTTSDPEFYEKLQQLLSMLSEYMKQLTSEKVPKVKQAVLSVLDVLDNFSLVYSNQSTYSSMSTNSINSNTLSSTNNNSSLYSNMSTCSNFEDLSVSKDMESNYLNNNNREHQRSDNVSTNYSSTATGLPIVYSNNTIHTINTNTSTNNTTSSNIPTNSFSSGYSMINTNTSTSNSNNNVQDMQYTMTTTATSFVNLDSSTEFELESSERRSNSSHSGLEVTRPRGPMAVENLVDVVDSEVLDRFRVVDNKSLDEALYNLCLWMTDNMKLVKSVDFYLLKLMSEFYPSFTNKLTVDMLFSCLFSQPLSDDGFSEVLEFLKKYQDLKVLNTLLSKNNSNTNRLLNPLNNLYYSQVTTSSNSSTTNNMSSSSNVNLSSSNSISSVNLSSSTNSNSSPNSTVDKVLLSVLELMTKYVSDENYTLVDEVVVKLVSFLAYFVKVKSESCSRLALDLLWSLNQRYEVSKYLDDELVASVTYSKPSKALSSAYLSSATRFEKYISKDLFMIMFQSDQDYKRRASYYWKGFVGDKTAKSRDMLEGKGRKDLTSWLSYCLFENMCHKYVVAGLELMSDYLLSKGLQFDAEESILLTESLCSYGTFGRYQTKAMSVYHKMARCLSYSFEAVQFMFEYVEKASSQWATVVSKALFNILEDAKKDTTSGSSSDKETTRKDSTNTTTSTIKDNTKELVSYVSKRLEMSSKMSTYYKNKLRQWVELVSKSIEVDSIVETTDSSRVPQASEKVSRARTSETGNLVQTHEIRNEIDEQLAATSLSEDSLRSKYFREENNTTSCNEKVYGSNRQRVEKTDVKELSKNIEEVDNISNRQDNITNIGSSYSDNDTIVVSGITSTSTSTSNTTTMTTTSSVVPVEEHTDRDPTISIRTKVVDSSRELESNKALQSTQSVLSSSKLDMESLETVHQDDYHSMEPVSTTDSNYESKANCSSSDFSYLSNQITYRDTTEEPQKSYLKSATTRKDSSNTTTSTIKDKVDWENRSKENENISKVVMEREYNTSRQDNSTNNNEDRDKKDKELSSKELVSEENKDSVNKQYVESQGVYTKELDNSVCPEVFYENKNMRVADREVVEDKGLNLVGQVLLDEDVNVDLDLESCKRLSQQIVDTPTSRLVEVPKRKSKDKYSQTDKSPGDYSSSNNNKDNRYNEYKENTDIRNEKRSCREVNNTTISNNSNEEVYGSMSNRQRQDNSTNTETTYKQDNVYSSVDMLTTSYSSRYDRQDKETQMSVSREFGKNLDSVSTRQDNSTNTTTSSKDRVDRETEVSVVRQYDKQTSVNLLESSRRSEYYDRREVELTSNLEMNPEMRLEMDSRLKFNLESKGNEILTNVEMSNLPLTKYKEYTENTDTLDKVDKQILEPDNTNKSSTSTSSSSKDTYPSVVVEFDSDLDFVSGEVYRLNLVETVLSHCSRVNNSCLVSSYKEYQKLADTLCPGNFSNTCLESCSQVLKYRSALKGSLLRLLSSPLVEMCHNAVLLLSKKLIKKLHLREQYDQTLDLEALTTTVEVFKIVTSDLQDKFVLQFCNVVTNLLSLPKDVYQNEKLYCLVSELVAENALKQSTDVMYKLLEVMVELSIESLEGDLDRLLMAKLRFTKILQMQILLTLKKNGNENSLDAETLKSKHINFIRRLETFANRRNAHNVEKVIQTSNYLISTI